MCFLENLLLSFVYYLYNIETYHGVYLPKMSGCGNQELTIMWSGNGGRFSDSHFHMTLCFSLFKTFMKIWMVEFGSLDGSTIVPKLKYITPLVADSTNSKYFWKNTEKLRLHRCRYSTQGGEMGQTIFFLPRPSLGQSERG